MRADWEDDDGDVPGPLERLEAPGAHVFRHSVDNGLKLFGRPAPAFECWDRFALSVPVNRIEDLWRRELHRMAARAR